MTNAFVSRTMSMSAATWATASAHAAAVDLETALPPATRNDELWPWLIAAIVVAAIGSSLLQLLKKPDVERRPFDSVEGWAQTAGEQAPRAHTASRLPSRDAGRSVSRKPSPVAKPVTPQSNFGRRSV